jgi:hypothetical protein
MWNIVEIQLAIITFHLLLYQIGNNTLGTSRHSTGGLLHVYITTTIYLNIEILEIPIVVLRDLKVS